MVLDRSRLATPDFDEETHTYRVDGKAVPSVTQILNACGIGHSNVTSAGFQISDEVMEEARERGTEIHLACQLLDEEDLDWETVSEEVEPYLIGYENWKNETGFVPDMIEQALYCEEFEYAGTIDRAGWIDDQRVVVDIKTSSVGLKHWHPKQLAAYAYCLKGEQEWPLRIVLELKRTTKKGFKAHHFSAKSADWDFNVFLAARTILRDKEMGRPEK